MSLHVQVGMTASHPFGGQSYFERVEDRIAKAVERGSAAARDLNAEK